MALKIVIDIFCLEDAKRMGTNTNTTQHTNVRRKRDREKLEQNFLYNVHNKKRPSIYNTATTNECCAPYFWQNDEKNTQTDENE